MTFLLAGLLVGVIAAGLFGFKFGFERQRQVYEKLVATIEADRDAARNEAKVFRGLLFPSINKAEATLGDVSQRPDKLSGEGLTVGRTSPKAASPSGPNKRIPFRLRFNQARKATNTQQVKTDALAEAIAFVNAQQKDASQEKAHV